MYEGYAELINLLKTLTMRGLITDVVSRAGGKIRVTVETFAGSVYREVPLMQHFGVTSVPPVGTRCTLVALNADSESLICIATQSGAGGPTLKDGELSMHSTAGSFIKVSDGISARGNTDIAGSASVTEDLTVDGDVEFKKQLTVKSLATLQNVQAQVVTASAITTGSLTAATDTEGNKLDFDIEVNDLTVDAAATSIESEEAVSISSQDSITIGATNSVSITGSQTRITVGANELINVLRSLVDEVERVTTDNQIKARLRAIKTNLSAIGGY